MRLGRFQVASLIYLTGMWLFATAVVALNGGIRSTVQVIYVTLPISAAWLLGYRAALRTATACLSTALVFALLEIGGVGLPRDLPGTPLGLWALLLIATLIGAVPAAHVLRTQQATLELLQREVAKRKRREQELLESEERFRIMANSAPVMIVVLGPDQRATFFNKVWLDFTGRTLEQELGKGWTAGVHPNDLEQYHADISSSFNARCKCHVEYRLRRADGEYRSVIHSGVPRVEPDGSFVGYIASLTDITEFKRRQEEALASQKLESLGVLAGGIAHDFNNMLGSILAVSEQMLGDLPNDSPAREGLEKIDVISTQAAGIVSELMAYAGQEDTAFEQVDLAKLVREMIELMRLSISKNAVLKVDIPDDVPLIRANSPQIRQVVMNLIINASDALEEKIGSISVALTQVQTHRESFAERGPKLPSESCVRLEVRDSGHGMTEELQARIFDPFFTTKGAGRGLGLAAVRGIILGHGGTINIQSSPGEGSLFEILLPCDATQPERDSRESVISAPPVEVGKLTGSVLMIDDENALRFAVARMLRNRGFSVLEAADAESGVDLFRSHALEIDVVLLDLTLPGMSGPDAFAELRKVRPDVKVVLTTAYPRNRAFAEMGPEPFFYIRKPYQIDELTELLRNVCMDGSVKSLGNTS